MKLYDFRIDTDDKTEIEEFDQNGDVCALIKIKTKETGFSYDLGSSSIIGDPIVKDGEIWLYVPYGIKRMTLRHQEFGTAELFIEIPVESGVKYSVRLSTEGVEKEVGEATISCNPANAQLFIDGDEVRLTSGKYQERFDIGKHSWKAVCNGYHTMEGEFDVRLNAPAVVNIKLPKKGEEQKPLIEFSGTPKEFLIPGTDVKFKMMPIPGGTFTQGAIVGQTITFEDELPQHLTTLSPYYIGETEVTQALWQAVMSDNPANFKGDDNPVEQVSWNACRVFISKLNAILGAKFRLPTEAEWEFAARGNNNNVLYSGSDVIADVAWFRENSEASTHSVATKEPNGYLLYDMSGNVREWVADLYNDYNANPVTDPKGAATGSHRVCRGGSWMSNSWNCHVNYRDINSPENTDSNTGLRLAM